MDEKITQALKQDRTIDITTTDRQSGQPRRIEIWFHNLDGRLYITGSPGTHSWYANLRANPEFTCHLKESVQADPPAKARPILDEADRRAVMAQITDRVGRRADLETWIKNSPLVEVEFIG